MNSKNFAAWFPARIYWENSRPMVDWCHLGDRRFTEPFFAQAVDQCVRHPADLLFRPQTPLDQLGELSASRPAARPAGLIFHMSRCGSTLISRMLAAAPENIVLSEPAPADTILRAHLQHPDITADQRVQWLQWLVAVWAWRRRPEEQNFFLKLDAWHTLFLPVIQRAFPGVPWIFVYRNPLEVMMSQIRRRGGHMIPGVLEPALFGWDSAAVARMSLLEYGARALARICEAALAQAGPGNGKFLNYRQLPHAAWPALTKYWQLNFSAEDTAPMQAAARMDSRNPSLPFLGDGPAKMASITPEIRGLVRQWLDGVYEQLESHRQTCGFADPAAG